MSTNEACIIVKLHKYKSIINIMLVANKLLTFVFFVVWYASFVLKPFYLHNSPSM